jgi:large subunit ribosomal protein L19
MTQPIMQLVENRYKKAVVPEFRVGDTVDVFQKIVESNKTRIQVFNGVVIARRGRGLSATFTARRIVNNEGVERIFMLHSPVITKIEVKRRGKVRRAKLHFLRHRVGKARRLRELRQSKRTKTGAGEAASTTASAPVEPAVV